MSADKITALQPTIESKPAGQGTVAFDLDESRMTRIPEELSILPVRGFVVFPGTVIPLNVQRAASLKLLDDTLPRTKVIGLLTQRDETKEDPSPQDLYSVGTAALVLKLIRQSEVGKGVSARRRHPGLLGQVMVGKAVEARTELRMQNFC